MPFAVWFGDPDHPRGRRDLVEPMEKRPHKLGHLVHYPVLLRPHTLVCDNPVPEVATFRGSVL